MGTHPIFESDFDCLTEKKMALRQWLFGPALKSYTETPGAQRVLYECGSVESVCESTIGWLKTGFSVFVVVAPWYYGYQPISCGFTNVKERYIQLAHSHGKCLVIVGGIYLLLCLLRSSVRSTNPMYRRYVTTFSNVELKSDQLLAEKRKWDTVSFGAHWPVDYRAPRPEKPLEVISGDGCGALAPVCHAIGHSFARWMIYPGATPLLNMLLRPTLSHERSKLLEQGCSRAKIESSNGDHIDTLFHDRRGNTGNGQILFITSEGNAGFMEVGSFTSVMASQYSTLGWNHPGFGDSTGTPYPVNDGAAMVAVVEYAINQLGFDEKNIVLYGWSIGGYSVVFGARHFPSLRGVYLDATFDDVMPLAEHVMSPVILPITTKTIRNIWNLNVAEYLAEFNGPVMILRRNRDEIMQKNQLNTNENRANFLLMSLITQRYPQLLTKVTREALWKGMKMDSKRKWNDWIETNGDHGLAKSILESHLDRPLNQLGAGLDDDLKLSVLLYLVDKHFLTFDATHGTPLPTELVRTPWQM